MDRKDAGRMGTLAVVLLGALAFTGGAQAAEVTADGNALRVIASAGEINRLAVEPGPGDQLAVFDDGATLRAGAGCSDSGDGAVTCPRAGLERVIVEAPGRSTSTRASSGWSATPTTLVVASATAGAAAASRAACEVSPILRRRSRETLNLPHLHLREARDVEEALIAHFGIQAELDRSGRGQLTDRRHEIRVEPPEYCVRLLRGQYVLALNGCRRYAVARFTRGKRCPGVGGSR